MRNQNTSMIGAVRRRQTIQETMEQYDTLPPEVRQVLRENAHNVTIVKGRFREAEHIAELRAKLDRLNRETAIRTYGDKYPVDAVYR